MCSLVGLHFPCSPTFLVIKRLVSPDSQDSQQHKVRLTFSPLSCHPLVHDIDEDMCIYNYHRYEQYWHFVWLTYLYICIDADIHTYTYICIYIYKYMHIHTHACTYIHAYINIFSFTYMQLHLHTYSCIHTDICIQIVTYR